MIIQNINRETLLQPLQAVIGVVERKQTRPILANVLLEYQNERLTLTASDAEIQISTSIDAEFDVDQFTPTTINGKKLLDILRILPEGANLSLEVEHHKAIVRAGRSRFNLQTLPAEDFPKLKTELMGATSVLTLPQSVLKKLLATVQIAMAQQDVRYYLNGMLLAIDGQSLRAVATDGHRLAHNACELEEEFEAREIILPRKAISELAKLLTDDESLIELEIGSQQVKAVFADTELITKVIDGRFPDYRRVIPNHPNAIMLSRIALQQALQRTAILSNEKLRGVTISVSTDCLYIRSNNSDQEEAQDEIEVNYQGPGVSMGFNINYLMDALSTISDEDIIFSFGDANHSTLLTSPVNPEFRYVVMPMRI